jgi:hypothetical protein
VGIFLGVAVLVLCLGLIALMMWSEWSEGAPAQPLAEAPLPQAKGSSRRSTAKKKSPAKKKRK